MASFNYDMHLVNDWEGDAVAELYKALKWLKMKKITYWEAVKVLALSSWVWIPPSVLRRCNLLKINVIIVVAAVAHANQEVKGSQYYRGPSSSCKVSSQQSNPEPVHPVE